MRFIPYVDKARMFIMPESLSDPNVTEKSYPISKLPPFEIPSTSTSFSYSQDLQQLLQGKELLFDEIPFPLQLIHLHYIHGFISYSPSILFSNDRYHCVRCGNEEPHLFATFSCARCQERCTYCRKCIQLGRTSECSPLIRWIGPDRESTITRDPLKWDGQLSVYQQKAAEEIVSAKEDLLVWAVCGSGKTEMLFPGIARALEEGKTILIATPRTDVVIELTPRLKQAFPTTEIISLYGGSADRYKIGKLTLATTHQVLRYYQAFDFIIIDEVDAFPYYFDKSLAYAINKARKPGATTIYLTATPSKKLVKQVNHVKIPRRYHGFPLPVPQYKWCGNWKKLLTKKRLPQSLIQWLNEKKLKEKQVFLFVPSVCVQGEVNSILQKNGFQCSGVHAEDKDRHQKVQQFRDGQLQVLITTTILERGVTVPNVDVAVLGAEENIFTESALVQIAGRVGRSKEHPTGDIIFFHYGKTTEMVNAKKHIKAMNEVEV